MEKERNATIETWADTFEAEDLANISASTIRNRLRGASIVGRTARSKTGRVLRNAYYSESDVRSACGDLLQDILKANSKGFIEFKGERYGTIANLAQSIDVPEGSISLRIDQHSPASIYGKNRQGNIRIFYLESEVRLLCQDLCEDMPQADENGMIVVDGEAYGTVLILSKRLGISDATLGNKIRGSSVSFINGRNARSRIYRYYLESEIYALVQDLIELPRADSSGLINMRGKTYAPKRALAKSLGLSVTSVYRWMANYSSLSIRGRTIQGVVRIFYAESEVRELCRELLEELPRTDDEGFLTSQGIRYGNKHTLSRSLGIEYSTICERLKSSSVHSIKGRGRNGCVVDFYPKTEVEELCKDLILPQADDRGFFTLRGARYGTKRSFSHLFGISESSTERRIKSSFLTPIQGRARNGVTSDFYPEPEARELFKDLLGLPQADDEGFFTLRGVRYGTREILSRLFGIPGTTTRRRLKSSSLEPIKGKTRDGHAHDFYPEAEVRELCADLITNKNK